MNENANDRLVWIDLEMTGLDPERDRILEIACVITDGELSLLAKGPSLAIHQPEDVLAAMDAWCQEHHEHSGLLARVRASTISLAKAEEEVLRFVQRWTEQGQAPLAGNSVHVDRRFLARWMPRLEAWLHYRIIDVSTIKELARRWYGIEPPAKRESHRALEDILESIEELRFYRRTIFRDRSEIAP